MTAHSLHLTGVGIIQALTPRPRPDPALLTSGWSIANQTLDEALRFIGVHQAQIASAKSKPAARMLARKNLNHCLEAYRKSVRRVSELEAAMAAEGISYEWERS